ncbi:MAG: Short-chain dehydrogenase/reductase [Alphaproteobacteria bacterium]|nr:Short-chain dehydrogenase/reductase [Alphaproteobacteria bacterium]
MNKPLQNQVAIVTGGSSGIGYAIARDLGMKGAAVLIDYRSEPEPAEALAREIIAAGGKAVAFRADVSVPEDITALVEKAVAEFGRLDIMVANAGLQNDAPALEMTVEQWDHAMNVDLRGQFLCAQAAARQFVKQGVNADISRASGKIVSMLSVHDVIPWMGHVNYAAAKGGAKMMMLTLAQEFAAHKIRVVGVSPGAIRTDINKNVWDNPQSYKDLLKLIPYQRIGEPEDVAKLVSWLVSDEADYITGTTIYVDGGMTLYPGFMGNG